LNLLHQQKAKLNIFDFNEMTLEDESLTSLNQEFKEYEGLVNHWSTYGIALTDFLENKL